MVNPKGDGLNPGQIHSDKLMNSALDLKKAESAGNSVGNSDVKSSEESPEKPGNWSTKVSKGGSSAGGIKSLLSKSSLKKKGPALAIILTLLGGGAWMGSMSLSALLPMAVASNLVQKFNIQETSATIRTDKIIESRMMGDPIPTNGSCNYILIVCRFKIPSNKFLKRLEINGIAAVDKAGDKIVAKGLFNISRPYAYRYTNSNGKVIDVKASEIRTIRIKDAEFRKGWHNASMTRFASLADTAFMKIKMRFGFTVADRLNTRVKADVDLNKGTTKSLSTVIDDSINIDNGVKSAIKNGGSEAVDTLTEKLTDEATAEAKKLSKGTSAITMAVGAICLLSDGPGLITKTVRGFQLAQLVKYSAVFLTAFGAIKAGDASPEEVSVIGNALSQTSSNGKSAMDSDGMNYVMNNDKIMKSDNYKKFAPGATVIAALAGIMAITNSSARKKTCKVAANPITGATFDTFLALNAGNSFGTSIAAAAVDMAAGLILGYVLDQYLPGMIEKVVQYVPIGAMMNAILGYFVGDLTKDLSGEDVGDALVSGASHIMGQTGNQGGNMPLSVNQAIAYAEITKQVQIANAEEDRATMSPFDPSSPNTMMGMMINKIIPYTTSSFAYSSIPNGLATISKVALGSIGTIVQPTTTVAADPSAEYKQCDDPDLKDNDVAAGPFCNIIYGIPPKYLDKDPVTVVEELVASGDIDKETGEPIDKIVEFKQSLKTWMELCTDGKSSQANNCKITDKTANFALYTIDHRIQKTMDEELPVSTSSGNTGTKPTGTGKQITIITYGHKDGPVPAHTNGFDADVQNVTDKIINNKHGFDPEVQNPILAGSKAKAWLAKMENEWYPKFLGGETISIGCARGHNRSISLMVAFTKFLRANGWTVTIHNRDFEFKIPPEYGDNKVSANFFNTFIASENSQTFNNALNTAGLVAA
ncbi:MAG: hypothetical protein WCK26_03075 [Candidatus Saccharibacteria bacterium]